MPLFSIPVLVAATLTPLALYKFIIYPAFISPLSNVPNAVWSAPFSPLWILRIRYTGQENRKVHAAHLKLGPVIRLAPNEISVNDLEGVRTVYGGGFEKGQWYSIFDNYGVPCMFSSWHSRPHSTRKRMMSNVYSKSTLHTSASLNRQAEIILYDRLLPYLASLAAEPQETGVDVQELWEAMAMDFVTAYQFGLKNGSNFLRDVDYRRRWLYLYYARKTYPYFTQELPRLTSFLKLFRINLVPLWVDDANRELEAWTKERCDATVEYLKSSAADDPDVANEPAVMKALLNGMDKESETKGGNSVLTDTLLKYPDLSIASEMIDQLAAGHETSAITLTYLTWELSRNLPLQVALRAELLTLSPNMFLSSSHSGRKIPTSKDVDCLPILNAIMMETLRLYAAIPGGQPRVTPYPSCSLGSYDIPGGVRVGAQAHSVHRNPSIYPDPEKFDYTRWIDDRNRYTEEQRRDRDRWFWAFSSGGRMCIGSNFAMHEIKLVTAAVYTNFRTFVVDDEGIEQVDGYTCGPSSNKLVLRFERISDPLV